MKHDDGGDARPLTETARSGPPSTALPPKKLHRALLGGEKAHERNDHRLMRSTGSTYELQGDPDGALFAYEQALRHNYQSLQALNSISCILRTKENFPRAVEYLQMMLKLDGANGEVWGSLGK